VSKQVHKRIVQHQRHQLQVRIHRWMEVPLAVLAIVMVVLLVIDLSTIASPALEHRVQQAETLIWAVFLVDFVLEFALAPSKRRYVRRNWITAISVLLPAFGVLRIVRAVQLLRGLSLLRVLAVFNRGARALGHVARRGQLGYVAALTAVVILTGAAAVFYFEHGDRGSDIRSFGDALWWSAALVTTINVGLEPATLEGRTLGFLMRIFALGVTGYITAIIAGYILGYRDRAGFTAEDRAEIRQLRREVADLQATLAAHHRSARGSSLQVEMIPSRTLDPGNGAREQSSALESDT
jgi:voltage-gated potassium channel